MSDVAENVLARLDPHVTVDTAIKRLLKKATTGKKLPDVPACGA